MKVLNNTLNNVKKLSDMKTFELLFVIVLVLYLISGVSTPYNLAPHVNNVFAHGSLVAITVVLFLYSYPLLAVFFGIVSLVFVNRSRQVSHSVMAPSQNNKNATMKNLNKHLENTSLEEEMVGQVVKNPDNSPSPSSYHPVMCKAHNASEV